MKKIMKYTSFVLLFVIALLLLLNEKVIYAFTNLNSFTSVEGISYYNTDEKFEVETIGIYGGIIIYVNDNNEVLAINVLNPDNTEINEYRIGDICTDTMEYNTEITSTEENSHTYGCNTIYQKENNNMKDIKKWKTILEFGDIYELDAYGYSSTFVGSYIENKFYNSDEKKEYLNSNETFNYYDYLDYETTNLCANYGNVFPENLECYDNRIYYDEETEDNSYSLTIGAGWYWSSPVYVFKEVVEPTFTLECDKKELSKGEETVCTMKLDAKEKITNIETELNADNLETKSVEPLNNWIVATDENKISLSNNEGVSGKTEVIKVTLINNENVKKDISVELKNINYIDDSGNNVYDDIKQDLTLIKIEKNPETSDFEVVLCFIIVISGISLIFLNINRMKKLL